MLYTPQERRHSGYATALTLAVSRAVLTGTGPGGAPGRALGVLGAMSRHVHEVVMITDKTGRTAGAAGSATSWSASARCSASARSPARCRERSRAVPMPRLPTGPLPRLPRLRR